MSVRHDPWPAGVPCWLDAQVSDVPAAADYYGQLFDWDLEDAGEAAGHYHLARVGGEIVAGLGPQPAAAAEAPATWTTYLASADVDTTARSISDAGGHLLMPPFDVMDQGRLTIAADPTGAVFGVWQAGRRSGITRYGEHGTLIWNELHTRQYGTARAFYAAVFGYAYEDIGGGETFVYCTLHPSPGTREIGGIGEDLTIPDGAPPYWLSWFASDDVDATAGRAADLGGSVVVEPDDSPFGRRAVVVGAQGEAFGVIAVPPDAPPR